MTGQDTWSEMWPVKGQCLAGTQEKNGDFQGGCIECIECICHWDTLGFPSSKPERFVMTSRRTCEHANFDITRQMHKADAQGRCTSLISPIQRRWLQRVSSHLRLWVGVRGGGCALSMYKTLKMWKKKKPANAARQSRNASLGAQEFFFAFSKTVAMICSVALLAYTLHSTATYTILRCTFFVWATTTAT